MNNTTTLTQTITNNTNNLNNFKQYLINESKSFNTINGYLLNLKDYFTKYSTLSRQNILNYIKQLKSKNTSAKTINHKLSTLKKYNLWLIETNQDQTTYILRTDFMKIQHQYLSPTKVDNKDIISFYNKLKSESNKRNIAITYLILSTGIRRAECADIKLNDINFNTNKLTIYSGKGSKQRTVLLNSKVIEILKEYINTDRNNYKHSNSPYLFISSKSDRIANETINAIMKPYNNGNITPHMLRHFWASNALSNDMNIVEVANNLGHSSIQTTMIYTHPKESDMRNKIENMIIV